MSNILENNDQNQITERSIAKDIWRDQEQYIYFAQGRFNINYEDAEDLFTKAGYDIVKHPERIDPNKTLKNFVKQRIKWIFWDEVDKKKRDAAALTKTEYNFTDKEDHFLEIKTSAMDKPLHLKKHSIKTEFGNKNIIYITTRNPHNANIGSAVFLSGLSELSKITQDRLRNKWGNEILINQIIDKCTFTIKVWFEHEINDIGIGEEKVRIKIKSKPSVLQNENLSTVLSKNTEEDKLIMKMRIEDCKKKFTEREKAILNLSLYPNQNINNNQRLTTAKMAEILGMAAGTLGEIAINIREAFIKCIESNKRVNV